MVLTLVALVCLPGFAMAALSGPVAGDSVVGLTTYKGYGSFTNGAASVTLGSNFISATDNSVGTPFFATGSLNWTGDSLVMLSFDYTISGNGTSGANNWIQYGDALFLSVGPTTLSANGSGHVSQLYDMSTFGGGPLMVQAYADGLASSVTISNISATPTPIPAAAWLLGSGLLGLVGIRRKNIA